MNTKQKAIVLLVCSALGNNFIFNNHAMAMKSLKKIFSSVPSEEKIMKLAYAKLGKPTTDLSKSDEEKLAAHVNSIVLPGGYIRVMNDKGEILKVNPLIFHVNRYKTIKFNNDKFMSIVSWVKVHIPDAFNPSATPENKITTPRSPLISAIQIFAESNPKVASAICNALIPHTDLSKKYSVELESRPNGSKVNMDMNSLDLVQCEQYKAIASTVPAFSSNHQVSFSHAVLSGNIDGVTKALSAGVDVNSKIYVKPYGNITPLDFALTARNGALFDCLIRHGAKVSPNLSVLKLVFARDSKDISNFWRNRSNISFLEKVLTCDKLSVPWDKKCTDFFNKGGEVWASEIIREFVNKNASIDDYAICHVAFNKQLSEDKKIEAANFIFQNKMPTSKNLNEALYDAIKKCNWKLARLLIEKGASVESTDGHSSPLGEAVMSPSLIIRDDEFHRDTIITTEWVEFIKFLVNDCNASIENAVSCGYGLCHAFWWFFFDNIRTLEKQNLVLDIARLLIEKGMNLNAVDSRGKTLLGGWLVEKKLEENRTFSDMGTKLYNLFVQKGAKKYL